MPELPEVETVRKVLLSWIKGKKVQKIQVLFPTLLANSSVSDFCSALVGQKLLDIGRYGKFLIFKFEEKILLSHLRMEGKYYLAHYKNSSYQKGLIYQPKEDSKFNKHVHLVFEFTDESLLLYHDVRKFGRFYLFTHNDYLTNPRSPLVKLGHEPFNEKDGTYLYSKAQKFKKTTKELLLDQSVLVGIGNIYADEICFLAKIPPQKSAFTLTKEDCDLLISKTQEVLTKALELGGSTVRSYHFANDASGRFQNELNVYGREGEPCYLCGTPISKTKIGGRGTHFCAHCQQELPSKKIRVIGVTGLISAGKSMVSSAFQKAGYHLVDADQIAKDCLVKGESCYQKVLETFGREILRNDGEIERSKLREIVVKDEVALAKLNSLIHPEVETVIVEKIKDERKCFLLDVPLLFEAGLDKLCDLTIFVNTHEKVRRKRLIARGTMPLKEAAKLNSSLLEAIKKMAKVDVIIDNSLTREATDFQVKSLIEKIRQLNLISK